MRRHEVGEVVCMDTLIGDLFPAVGSCSDRPAASAVHDLRRHSAGRGRGKAPIVKFILLSLTCGIRGEPVMQTSIACSGVTGGGSPDRASCPAGADERAAHPYLRFRFSSSGATIRFTQDGDGDGHFVNSRDSRNLAIFAPEA